MSDPRCSLCGDYLPNHTATCDITQYRAEIARLREENDAIRIKSACLESAEKEVVELKSRLAQARERLKAHHHPFSHDYIKDEKWCEECRFIRALEEPQ